MKTITIRPSRLTLERLEKIADHLESVRPSRPKPTHVIDWLAWFVERELAAGTLTQAEIRDGKKGVAE